MARTPSGSVPRHEHTEAAISAGMASGDTDAVMRAVANSDIVVPQATVAPGERGAGRVALAARDRAGRHVVRPGLHLRARRCTRPRPSSGDAVAVSAAELGANWPSDDLWLGRQPRHRGRAHPPAGRRPVAAGPTPSRSD